MKTIEDLRELILIRMKAIDFYNECAQNMAERIEPEIQSLDDLYGYLQAIERQSFEMQFLVEQFCMLNSVHLVHSGATQRLRQRLEELTRSDDDDR